jgi:hypothetical protein
MLASIMLLFLETTATPQMSTKPVGSVTKEARATAEKPANFAELGRSWVLRHLPEG